MCILVVASAFLFFIIIFPLHSAAYTRYRPIGTDGIGKENRGSSPFSLLSTSDQQQRRIEHWFGSPRNNVTDIFDSSCVNRKT